MAKSSDLSERIDRYAALNAERKALEKEEEALREWFREQAKGKDVTFGNDRHEVVVTRESRRMLDRKKLIQKLGEAVVKKYETVSSFLKVTVREVEKKEKTA